MDTCDINACDQESCEKALSGGQLVLLSLPTVVFPLCLLLWVLYSQQAEDRDSGQPVAREDPDHGPYPSMEPRDKCSTLHQCCSTVNRRVNRWAHTICESLDGFLSTGMMCVMFIFFFGFNFFFFGPLSEEHPCSTGLGSCTTISCISANVYAEGYVFMFSALLLTSFALCTHAWQNMRSGQRPCARFLIITGCLLLTLTGFFPATDPYKDSTQVHTATTGGSLHVVGVTVGSLLLSNVPDWLANESTLRNFFENYCLWFCYQVECGCKCSMQKGDCTQLNDGCQWPKGICLTMLKPRTARTARTVYAWLLTVLNVLFVLATFEPNATSNFCTSVTSGLPASCELWPQLDANTCKYLKEGKLVQPRYRCSVVNRTDHWHEIDPSLHGSMMACKKTVCRLWPLSRCVALEFAVLFLTLCKYLLFGINDIKMAHRVEETENEPESSGGMAALPQQKGVSSIASRESFVNDTQKVKAAAPNTRTRISATGSRLSTRAQMWLSSGIQRPQSQASEGGKDEENREAQAKRGGGSNDSLEHSDSEEQAREASKQARISHAIQMAKTPSPRLSQVSSTNLQPSTRSTLLSDATLS